MTWVVGVLASVVVVMAVTGATWVGFAMQPWGAAVFAPPPPSATPGVVPLPAVQAPHGPLPADGTPLLAAIQQWLGTPYLFGGCTLSGVDCSCFVQHTARALGYSLPRTAQQQWDATERISSPEVGALVFFHSTYASSDRITHVGWVVGPGVMVSAAVPAVGRQSLESAFWRAHLAGYGRVRR